MCEQAVREGEGLKEVKQVYSTGSSELVLSTEVSPLRNRDGHITGAILVFDDVTEQSRLEQELIRVEKLAVVGQMVITVNHEINNPLNIISNNAQALRLLNPDFNDKTVTKLRSIEEQVKRIAQVTERLRTMEQVTTDSYIADGPQMVDVWGSERRGGS
jgi:C4-dicarboxylate-specific signal transduction histidine kinase